MAVRSLLRTLVWTVALAACAAPAATEPAGATCDQFASTPSIAQSRTIESGTELTVVLCSNPTTGFAWGDPEIGDTAVLQLVDRAYRAPEESSLPIAGAAGGEILTIQGLAAGTTTLSIGYGQPWAGGVQDEWTYVLSVTVQ
jgi:predicted secreted protein